jgi:integrase
MTRQGRRGIASFACHDRPCHRAPGVAVPRLQGANLRTAITRACRLTGTPGFSPHELRKRRGSLLGKQGYSLPEIAERLGDTKNVTAEHSLFAIGDYAEADDGAVLSRLREDVGLDRT